MNLDSMRVNIFKELMTLDKNNLQKLYAYILTLTKRKETVEVTLLEEMLDANAEYALKAHERGDVYNRRREKLYRRPAWMEVIWTKKAIESFKELAFYLNNSFGKDITASIIGKVTRRVNDLLRNPLLGKEYESSNFLKYEFRFFVINKQTKVFYFIQGEFVYIVLVFDVRQDIRRIHEMLSSIK